MNAGDDDGSLLTELVAECLVRLEDDGPGAVDALCAEHPALADAIRQRVQALAAAGLLDDAGSDAPAMPEQVGDFRLVRRLGGGGMGIVYLAEQGALGREVALKLVRPELLYFDGARQRFAREVEAVARLRHPAIVPVHSAGEDRGVPYLAMEYVPGMTLAEVVAALVDRAPARLSARDLDAVLRQHTGPSSDSGSTVRDESWPHAVARLGVQAADALEHAHAQGVLHRDVKPSNLMVTGDRRVLLLDFGLALAEGDARLTSTGAQVGSLAYMAPEQLRGRDDVDARTDVYGLGVTLYELLALRPAFAQDGHDALRQSILAGRLPALRTINPGVSADLAIVVSTALQPEPTRRYASAAALRDDLLAVLEARPIRARAPSAFVHAQRWVQRRPSVAVACLLGLVLAVGGPLSWALVQREANARVTAALDRATEHLGDAQAAVESMLADVARHDLEHAPGMGDLRRELLERALAFCERISSREGDGLATRRITARAAFRVGLIHMQLAEFDAAGPALETGLARADMLLDEDANDLDGLELRAHACAELAKLARERDEPAEVEVWMRAAESAFEAWVAASGSSAARSGLAQLLHEVAVFAHDRSDLDAALSHCDRALAQLDALHPQGDSSALSDAQEIEARVLELRGDTLQRMGRGAEAEAPLRQSVLLLTELLAERPQDIQRAFSLAMSRGALGRMLVDAGHLDQARPLLESSLTSLESLRERAPAALWNRTGLHSAHMALASLADARGDASEAVEHYLLALQSLEDERSPDDPDPRMEGLRSVVRLALGNTLRDFGAGPDAVRVLDDGLASIRVARAADPANGHWHSAHANLLWTHGLTQLDSFDGEACLADARELRDVAAGHPFWLRTALSLLARVAHGSDDARAEALRDEGFDWLDELLEAGWDDLDDLRTSGHFSGLRDDPRFERRLAEHHARRPAP